MGLQQEWMKWNDLLLEAKKLSEEHSYKYSYFGLKMSLNIPKYSTC